MTRIIAIGFTAILAVSVAGAHAAPARRQGGKARMTQAGQSTTGTVLREWKGLSGGVRSRGERVVRTAAAWTSLWRDLHADEIPPPAAPRIDFAKQMVLAVFMGERPTGGYTIQIGKIAAGDREIRVTVQEQGPPPDAMTTQALTQPFHVVVVQRNALPVKFVRSKAAVHRD